MTAIVVGETTFRDLYADGNIKFVVMKNMGNGTYQCISIDEDYDGIERYYSTAQIRDKVAYARNLERLFTEKNDYWATRKVGEVLHYHNGHGNYVRGVVVEIDGEKKLRPTALVGKWSANDLPKRRSNGEIYYPYNVDKIVNASDMVAAWQPHESCVYESASFCPPGTLFDVGDPRVLEPIDLTVPDMTPGEARIAKLERTIGEIQELIATRYETAMPAIDTLNNIKDAAETAIDEFFRTR